ncbi:MAG: hypothetical protein ABIF40_03855 [archaeon]
MAATDDATITLTQAGSAGITLPVSVLGFGSGYYNASCTVDYSELDSFSKNSACWINTTDFLATDTYHVIENSGSSVLNITADTDKFNAENLFCSGVTCPGTTSAEIAIQSQQNETGSCNTALTTPYEKILDDTKEYPTGLCDELNFQDSKDTIRVYYRFRVPIDAHAGAKTLTVTYEGIAV